MHKYGTEMNYYNLKSLNKRVIATYTMVLLILEKTFNYRSKQIS